MNFLKKLFGGKQTHIQPEDLYSVIITDDYIKVTHPKRPDEIINWKDIEMIQLVNTDEGPLLPDVWMLLIGNNKGCSIPQGSKGWNDIYDIVSKYPGFNFENVIKSAACTRNEVFEVWKSSLHTRNISS